MRTRTWGPVVAALASFAMLAGGVIPAAVAIPVPSSGHAALYGVVTPSGVGTWDPKMVDIWLVAGGSKMPRPAVGVDGSFEFNNLAPGTYTLSFRYDGGTWGSVFWHDSTGATQFVLQAGEVKQANGIQELSSVLSGTVIPPQGEALSRSISFKLFDMDREYQRATWDPVSGTFTFAKIAAGTYELKIEDTGSAAIGSAYWSAAGESGRKIVIAPGSTNSGFDVVLPLVKALSGVVTYEASPGVFTSAQGMEVRLIGVDGSVAASTVSDALGKWMLGGELVPAGDYAILATPHSSSTLNVLPTDWNDQATVPLVEAVHRRDVNVAMRTGGEVTMRLFDAEGQPNSQEVKLISVDPSTGKRTIASSAWAQPDGSVSIRRVLPGTYVVSLFGFPQWDKGLYLDGEFYFSDAKAITIAEGQKIDLGNQVVTNPPDGISRLAGSNRYETSVLVSKELFADGEEVPLIYLVNGEKFADSLTVSSAATALGGGLLLTTPASLPQSSAKELQRLKPQRVVIVGSPTTVSETVVNQVRNLSPDSEVERLGGANRFETAALVVRDAYKDSPEKIFLTTGQNFPDALAAAPRAARDGAALVIIDSGSTELPQPIRELLEDYDETPYVQAIGNEASVPSGVVREVAEILNPDNPDSAILPALAGKDRWWTAYELDIDAFMNYNNNKIYIASGESFPDALTLGPLIGGDGDRLVISRQSCIPQSTGSLVNTLSALTTTVVGGPGSLSEQVLLMEQCQGEPSTF